MFGVDEHRRGTVDHVPGGDEVSPRLEEILELPGFPGGRDPPEDGEDAADGDIRIDVR